MKTTRVVILGAGFAGIRAAQDLPKTLKSIPHEIILVDCTDVHLYTPDLYEIASAFNQKVTYECTVRLKETVAVPIRSLINPHKVEFIQDWVAAIRPQDKIVVLKRTGKMPYDILVVALGSVPAFFNIPGLKEHAYSFKTIRDALAINSHLDHLFFTYLQTLRSDRKRRAYSEIHVAVGGGGAAGVELVAELGNYLDLLAEKYRYPRSKIQLHLIEGLKELAGMGTHGTRFILKRLRHRFVIPHLGAFITRVDKDQVHVKTSLGKRDRIPCQFFIWTGGVQANSVVAESLGDSSLRGAVRVKATLQTERYPEIFAAGDNAALLDLKTGNPLPMLAQFACLEGCLIADNISRFLNGKLLKVAHFHTPVMVVPLGGRYGVMKVGRFFFKGRRAWFLHRLISLRYAMTILPFWKAFKKWRKDTKIFVEND